MIVRFACLLALVASSFCFGQTKTELEPENTKKQTLISKKSTNALVTDENITINGQLDEAIWSKTATASNFISFESDNGNPIPDNKKTEVKIAYDNNAIYIGAILHDEDPTKILKEIVPRDNPGTADSFGVFINGYNDGQQDFQFYVSASNGQADCIVTDSEGEDYSWDAVWESKVKITAIGWVIEMRIPYAALRFSSEKKQTWGLNFFREVRRDRFKYTWNHIDTKIGSFTQQAGILEGIENIKTPTRLFLLPYSSYYLNADSENKTKGTLKGGLDIKYGLSDAFTLDAVLIPDFGQTAVDQKILNLGPFDQQFNENRPFFTEGTDLFSKGNLLYSRRIGGNPTGEILLSDDEEIIENPQNVSLLNAIKISGRTKEGLGIGFLNAVTKKTYASVRNNNTGETRSLLTEPLANYNVTVFDQRFRKNSSISFINTNVIRNGHFRDGNASALVWDLNTKANTYNLQGTYKLSIVNENSIYKNGTSGYLELNKTSGKYRYGFGGDITTKKYDNNDLGINNETNYYSLYANGSYRILNPSKHFNRLNINSNFYNQFQIQTSKPQLSNFNLNLNFGNKKNNAYGMNINSNPIKTYDYYEARVDKRYILQPKRIGFGGYYSSNYNKKFAYDIDSNFSWADQVARNAINLTLSPRYRFSDKLSFIYKFNYSRLKNNKGYATQIDTDINSITPDDIIIGNRNIISHSNTVTSKYAINSQMNFNLSVNHYWSYSENKNFLLLEQNGTLSNYTDPVSNQNKDFSNWNLDLNYSWWFAPGSQVSVLYRNNSGNFNNEINKDLGRNFTNLIRNDILSHTFSVSVKYFIDYNQVKNIF